MARIMSFGDSITLGEADELHGGWADRLKRYYFEQCAELNYQVIKFYNLGIGGETTDGLKKRFAIEYAARAINGQQNIVLLAYGANDIVIHKQKNIVPQAYFKSNLEQVIEQAQESRAEVILLSLLPIADTNDGVVNQHRNLRFSRDIDAYNEVLQSLASKIEIEYLDLHGCFVDHKDELLCSDGVHPNSLGHQVIFEKIKALLDRRIKLESK